MATVADRPEAGGGLCGEILPETGPWPIRPCAPLLLTVCAPKEEARHMGGFVVRRCRLLPALARSCQAGEAEAEEDERAGLGDRKSKLERSHALQRNRVGS